jgi:hypothetical protein
MRAPQDILREIMFVIGLIISFLALVWIFQVLGLSKHDGNAPSAWILVPFVSGLLLGFKSTRWMMQGIEYITGFSFAVFGRGIIFMFMIGFFASLVVIPVGLVLLTMQYFQARKFHAN